jgi:acylpyruvate hydrolase
MKIATVRTPAGTRAVRVDGDRTIDLGAADVRALLASGPDALARAARATGEERGLDPASLAPVVPWPDKIICLGHNYLAHITEMGGDVPSHPTLFAKYARALIGPRDPIVLPAVSDAMDWEVELAIVVGRQVRGADRDEAAEAIAGYTVLNDVSARDWQRRTKQWLQGKTFEGTTPVGPWMVTPDEVDHAADLVVRCEVDGDVVQEARTSDLLFRPADVVAYVSEIITLDPGDVIATGTPAGVGAGRTPPRFLKPGNILRTSISGIGELENECVAAST